MIRLAGWPAGEPAMLGRRIAPGHLCRSKIGFSMLTCAYGPSDAG